MNLCLGIFTKEGQRTDLTKTQISQGMEKKYHGRHGGWMKKRKKKKPLIFVVWLLTFQGWQTGSKWDIK